MIRVGTIRELIRYPVKSMAGVPTENAYLGFDGLHGDRRFAFRRLEDKSGFPWLTASKLPELILYKPVGLDESTGEPLPTHVMSPTGETLELASEALAEELSARFGKPLEIMNLKHGIFDDAAVSVIAAHTIEHVCSTGGASSDHRRFRPNILLDCESRPFVEDEWVGGSLTFGEGPDAPAIAVTARDIRCMMINLEPDTAEQNASILKAVVKANDNNAGVYGTVVKRGTLRVGDPVNLVSK